MIKNQYSYSYSLMGIGFHSGNGRNQDLLKWPYLIYIPGTKVFFYGLEVLFLKKKNVKTLERFQRKSLRQIQELSDRTQKGITLTLKAPITTIIVCFVFCL